MDKQRQYVVDDENWAEISSRIVNETGTIESLMQGKDSSVPHGKKKENVDGDSHKDSPSEIVPPVVQEPVAPVQKVMPDTASSMSEKEDVNDAKDLKGNGGIEGRLFRGGRGLFQEKKSLFLLRIFMRRSVRCISLLICIVI